MERRLVPRSAELMSQQDTVLLVIDIQEKLIGKIENAKRLVWNVRRLLDGAGELGLKILATEQYPKGLGPMLSELAEGITDCSFPISKYHQGQGREPRHGILQMVR